MYYIGLDVQEKTISYCVKDAAGHVYQEGKIGSTRRELEAWVKALPQPRMMAMETTIFTGWIYDHLLPRAEKVKVAHPLMLRAIIAAKKKNDRIDASKIADCLRCDFLPECHIASTEIRDRRRTLRCRNLLVKQMVQMKNRMSGLLLETEVSYNKSRLYKVGYFADLMSIKLRLLLDHDGYLPSFAVVAEGKCSELNVARDLRLKAGTILAVDRGCNDYVWFGLLTRDGLFLLRRL